MDEAQIYHIPNWDTQDEQEWALVKDCLVASSPYHLKDEKGALSGVDCMICIIQHILCSLAREESQHVLQEHLSHNFLLDLAIRDFASDTTIQRKNMQNVRDVFWGMLCRKEMGTSGTPSFLEIDQSALMQGTLWLGHSFQAFHESLVMPRGSGNFQAIETLDKYPSDIDTIRTSRSRFTWDTSLHTNFEEMFESHFRETQVDGEHGTYTLLSKAPKVARVLFDPTKASIKDFSISSLYRMSMATRRKTYKPRDDAGAGWVAEYSIDRVTYNLIAVVRLRGSQHEHDYVRLYDQHGHPVVPRGPSGECTSYHSDDWSIRDQDHKYMLYYMCFVAPPSSVPPPSCVPPSPSSSMERTAPAPQVSRMASEVARRRAPLPPGQMSTQELFDSWAADRWADLKRQVAEREQAERSKRSKQAEQAEQAGGQDEQQGE